MAAVSRCRILLSVTLLLLVRPAFTQVLFTWSEPYTYCAPAQILFNDLTSPPPGSWQWEVTGPESFFSSAENPGFTFTTPGSYQICLRVNGNPTPAYCEQIEIYAPPQANFQVAPGYSPTGQAPLTICFEDLSIAGSAPIVYYEWDLGIPPVAIDPNPCVTYPSATEAQISLVISDCNGCWDDYSTPDNFIEVFPDTGVIAGFEIVVNPGQECSFPLEFTCYDRSLGDVTSWNYALVGPNLASSNLQDAQFIISVPGMYSITQTINNGDDSYVEEFTISLPLEGPETDFTANRTASCFAPFPVELESVSEGAYRYAWEVVPNTVSGPSGWQEASNPEIVFERPGYYSVSLTATDVVGCTTVVDKQDFILVTDSISAAIVSDAQDNIVCGASQVCFEAVVNILQESTDIADILWELPGAIPESGSGNTICADFAQPGVYDVRATIYFTGGCDSLVVSDLVLVGDRPQLTADVNPTSLCLNECVQGSAVSNLPNTRFDWYFEAPSGFVDGGIGMTSTVSYCYTEEWHQPFTVQVIGINCLCSDTVELEVSVFPPAAQFTWETGCYPSTEVSFIAHQDLGVFADSGAWYINGQNGSPIHTFYDMDDADFTYDFGTAGSFSVQLVLHSSFSGCTDSVTHTVVLPEPLIPDFSGSPRSANCPPLTVNLAPGVTGFMDTIYWYPGNGDGPIATLPPHSFSYTYTDYAENGWFDISMVYENGACRDSLTKAQYIRLSPASGSLSFDPDSGIAPLGVVFSLDDVQYTDSILWFFGQGDSLVTAAHAAELMVSFSEPGIYYPYIQLLSDGCLPVTLEDGPITVFTISVVQDLISGILQIRPNPVFSDSRLTWMFTDDIEIMKAIVVDASGRIAMERDNPHHSGIGMEGLPAGHYILILETLEGMAGKPFIVVDR